MKKCLPNLKFLTIVFAMMLMASVANAANRTASVSGDWNTLATWGGAGIPNAGDNVTINTGIAVTVNVVNAACTNLTINGTGSLSIGAFNFAASGTIVVNGSIILTSATGTKSFDNMTIAATGTFNSSGNANVTLTGSLNNLGTLSSGTGTWTFSGGSTLAGTATITTADFTSDYTNNGTYTYTNLSATGAGNVYTNAGTTTVVTGLTGTGSFTGTGTLNFQGASIGITTFTPSNANGTVNYSGTAQTVRGVTYFVLALSNSGVKTLPAGVATNDDFNISGSASVTTANALTVGNDLTLTNTASLTTGANLTVDDDVNVGAGTSFTIGAFNFAQNGGNGVTTIDGTLTSNSTTGTKAFEDIIINSGGIFNSSANEAYSVDGNLQVNGTGLLTSGSGIWSFANGSLSGTGSATITNAVFTSNYSNSGTFSFLTFDVSAGPAITFTNNGTITISTSLTGTDTYTQGGSSTLNFAGASIAINNFNPTGANNLVNYNGATQAVIADTYEFLTLSGSNAKTFSAGTTVNDKLSIQGTATVSGVAVGYAAAAILEYKGSAAQTISNLEFTGTGANPTNLTIDNSAGVTLLTGKSINGTLALVHGYLTTTGVLLINNNGTATTANGAFVNGQLNKSKNTTTRFDFPVGNLTGGLRIAGVTPQNTTTTIYGASFTSASPKTSIVNGNSLGGIQQISACEYWNISQVVGAGSTPARITLSWPASTASCGSSAWGPYITQPSTLLVAHHNGANWTNEGNSGTTVVTPGTALDGGTVTSTNFLATFSPFTIGTTNGAFNPLPVLFGDVKAFEKGAGVQIEWTNLTEKDVVSYSVERSVNGRDFISISQLGARSNISDAQSYLSFDGAPSSTNFYRIKVVEADGHIVYSKLMKVDIGKSPKGLVLYPNPVVGNDLSIGFTAARGQYNLSVVNAAGQQIYSQKINHAGGTVSQAITLPSAVKSGVYNMMISGDNYKETKMFVIQ